MMNPADNTTTPTSGSAQRAAPVLDHAAAIRAATRRLEGVVHRTPVITSASLDELIGCRLFGKAEHLQKTGAFKYRGASNAVATLPAAVRSVCTHSSGNHGAALAAAAARNGLEAHIVMPENSVPVKVDAVRAYGGRVHFCQAGQRPRELACNELVEQGHRLVPPYDDWAIIHGQATATLELLDEIADLDAIIVPVGGGGLAAGACLAVATRGRKVPVIAAEPEGAADTHASLQAGRRITDMPADTVADGLRATIGKLTFSVLQRDLQRVLLVGDDRILAALELFWRHTKQLIEPSSATVIAALLEYPELLRGRRVGIILSGGNVNTRALLPALGDRL